jgi:pteridine reductase
MVVRSALLEEVYRFLSSAFIVAGDRIRPSYRYNVRMASTCVALVTGAAKRVGRCVALRLAEEGFDLAFTYLSSGDDAKELCEQIRAMGRKCVMIRADLTKPDPAIKYIRKQFQANFSRLDLLMNNASLYAPDDGTSAQAARFWAIHVLSPMLLARAMGDLLRKSRGHVVNMVDGQTDRPMASYSAYSASKAGLLNLTLSLAKQLAPQVTVNGIAPGVVEWPPGMPAREKRKYLRNVPLKRAGTPSDVAEAVIFFSRSESYVTGQILRLDGGRSLI